MNGLALVFGGAMAAILVAGIVLSELMSDPDCTEGPCTQDIVQYVTAVLLVFIGVLWLIAAFAYDADQRRDSNQDGDS